MDSNMFDGVLGFVFFCGVVVGAVGGVVVVFLFHHVAWI